MSHQICKQSFTREASALARRLDLGRGYLLRHGEEPGWGVWSAKNDFARPVGTASENLVAEMLNRDLLVKRPGGGLMLAHPADRVSRRASVATTIANDEGRPIATLVNEMESALGWLRKRKNAAGVPLVSDEQLAAAERLRRDYTLAQMEQRLTTNWEAPQGGGRAAASFESRAMANDAALAAKQRLYAALEHVGPELSGLLLEICCMAAGLEHAERLLGLPQRSGKAVLQIGLTRLARYYGLLPEQSARPPDGRVRRWAAPDYRPRVT